MQETPDGQMLLTPRHVVRVDVDAGQRLSRVCGEIPREPPTPAAPIQDVVEVFVTPIQPFEDSGQLHVG